MMNQNQIDRPNSLFAKNQAENGYNDGKKGFNLTGETQWNLLFKNLDEIINLKQKDSDKNVVDSIENKNSEILNDDEFLDEFSKTRKRIYQLAFETKQLVKRTILLYNQIEVNVSMFDCDDLKSNGYRSVLNVYDACIRRLFLIVRDINEKKRRISSSGYMKDFESWSQLLEKLEILLEIVFEMQTISLSEYKKNISNQDTEKIIDKPSMFFDNGNLANFPEIEENVLRLSSEHSVAFFGKTLGFHFCESLKKPLTGVAIAYASYKPKISKSLSSQNIPNDCIVEMSMINIPPRLKTLHRRVKSEINMIKVDIPKIKNFNSSSNNTINIDSSSASNLTPLFAPKTLVNSAKCILDSESRSKKYVEAMKNADFQFCKDLWDFPEDSLVKRGSDLIIEKTAINVVKEIKVNNVLKLPKIDQSKLTNFEEFVSIQPPCNIHVKDYINVRILSHALRDGMRSLDTLKTVESGSSSNNYDQSSLSNYLRLQGKSKSLILHVHGGGFIAQSSRSHEIYLRPWCNELQVPIISVDYSLAPAHPFPRASEECFYIYAWCLLNKEALGWTGERIICVGDSAGALLITNIVQRAIMNGIRIPDALVPIYGPFNLNYSMSPCRLLSVLDPLLNTGILWRSLGAYCGINFKSEVDNFHKNSHVIPKSNVIVQKSISKRLIKRFANIFRISSIHESADVVNELNTRSIERNNRLNKLHEFYGDSIVLIEKIKTNELCKSPLMSPLLADNNDIAKFPTTYLITSNYDAFLDDNIEFSRKLKHANVIHEMIVFENLNHGFLNMVHISKDCHKASNKIASNILKNIINEIPIE